MTPDEIGLNCYRDHSALKEATESSSGSLFFIADTKTPYGDLGGLGQMTMVCMAIANGMVPCGNLSDCGRGNSVYREVSQRLRQ